MREDHEAAQVEAYEEAEPKQMLWDPKELGGLGVCANPAFVLDRDHCGFCCYMLEISRDIHVPISYLYSFCIISFLCVPLWLYSAE